jgi:hypothetical protein
MNDVVRQLAGRFLRGFGIADRPVSECVERIGQPYNDDEAPLRVVEATSDVAIALEYLSALSWPASRHVAFAVGENTAFINNSRNGSDYADHVVWLARYLNARFARVVHQDGYVWTNGVDREVMRYAAVIFDLRAPNGESVRSVSCMNDGGRWHFGESGPRLPVEGGFPYDAPRKRDRFTATELAKLAKALRIPTVGQEDLLSAERFYLIHSRYSASNACTVSEADDPAYGYYIRGLTWVPWIETHASSVIADFERCLRLNPYYESKVRDSLDRAYDIVNSQSDA